VEERDHNMESPTLDIGERQPTKARRRHRLDGEGEHACEAEWVRREQEERGGVLVGLGSNSSQTRPTW
jgi:hypothetical protein